MKILIIVLMIIPAWSFAQKESKVIKDSLPSSVNAMLNKKYKKYKIDNVSKIVDKAGDVSFNLSIIKKNKVIDFIYDKYGRLVSKNKYYLYIVNQNSSIIQKPSGGNVHNRQPAFSSGGGHQH